MKFFTFDDVTTYNGNILFSKEASNVYIKMELFDERLFLMNTFINENGIIVVTNVRSISNVANIYR
ncbi:hypothetical protein BwiPL1_55780 (plasmid) [Bacillus wiedmannii]|nr:hypothetical protein BwiPL1_55780 [Bacillus wiedmannii]